MTRIEAFGWRGAVEPGIGRIVSAHGDYLHLVANEAEGEILARKKKSVFGYRRLRERNQPPEEFNAQALKPLTGDFVRFRYNAQGESLVTEVLPRFSHFERRDPTARRQVQTLAVNFDTLFVVTALNGDFSPARLQRYLTLAQELGEAEVAVLLTKADLVDAATVERALAAVAALPLAAHVRVLALSAVTGAGMAELREYERPGRTLALVGSSGVGKSTLLNALAGEEWAATQEIQEWSGRGRHTTTSRELLRLASGALVLDTPGIREIGMLGEAELTLAKGESTHRRRK